MSQTPRPEHGRETVPVSTEDLAAAGHPQRLGRYQIIAELGRGAMGVVYRAYDEQLQRPVALKVLPGGPGGPAPDWVERFVRESRTTAGLDHPNIVKIYDVGESDGSHYFTMELIIGTSMYAIMKTGELTRAAGVRLVRKIAAAVGHAHARGLVHRDLKPENVLIDAEGRPKVTDFGLAKEIGDQGHRLTASGVLMGTPLYMSPEQAMCDAPRVGPTSDVWSLGVVLYELLSGTPPFEGETLRTILNQIVEREPPKLQGVARDLETICLKCLDKDPARRYPDAAALAEDLRRFIDHEPIEARPVGRATRLVRRARKQRAVLIPTGLAVLLGVGLGGRLVVDRVQRHRQVELLVEQARAFEANRDYEQAREAYRSARVLEPGRTDAVTGFERAAGRVEAIHAARRQAMALLEQTRPALAAAQAYLFEEGATYAGLVRKTDVALERAAEAVELAPDLAIAQFLLGRAWRIRGRDDRAEAAWKKSLMLDPDATRPRLELARLLLERLVVETMGTPEERELDPAQAEALLATARRHVAVAQAGGADRESGLLHILVESLVALATGERAHVLSRCGAALKTTEHGKEDLYWLCGLAQPGPAAAEKLHGQAIQSMPRHALALYARGRARLAMGELSGADADFHLAIRIRPRLCGAYLGRAAVHILRGEVAAARRDCDQVLEISPGSVVAWSYRSQAAAVGGDWPAAVRDAESGRGRPLSTYVRGQALFGSGSHEAAVAALERLESQGAPRALLVLARAERLFAARKLREAAEALGAERQALGPGAWGLVRVFGAAREAHLQALLAMTADKPESASEHAGRALSLVPGHVEARGVRSKARVALGDVPGALSDLDRALEIAPGRVPLLVARGKLRERAGNPAGALADYQAARPLAPKHQQFALDALIAKLQRKRR